MRRFSLVGLGLVACSSGSQRDTSGTSASIGEASTASSDGSTAEGSSTAVVDGSSDGGSSSLGGGSSGSETAADESSGAPPASCAEDPSACDAWFLARGATVWEAVTIGGPAALAPSSPVLAAFDIENPRIAFVLTADEVIEVDLDERRWVSKATVADRFPEVSVPVLSAYSIPAHHGGNPPDGPESVNIAGSDVAFGYVYDDGAFVFQESNAFGEAWNGPRAPQGDAVRAMWLDVANADDWIAAPLPEACPNADGAPGPYLAAVTEDAVHVVDVGTCFDFFAPVPYASFAPFALDGAPPSDRIGGAAYNETTGLVIFAGD